MRNKFRIALLSMAAVGLVGCADKLADESGGTDRPGSSEGSVYMNVAVALPSASSFTRSGTEDGNGSGNTNSNADPDFENAYADESRVKQLMFVIASMDDVYITHKVVATEGNIQDPTDDDSYSFTTATQEFSRAEIDAAYGSIIKDEDNNKVKIYVYCNPSDVLQNAFKNISDDDKNGEWRNWAGKIDKNGEGKFVDEIWTADEGFLMSNAKIHITQFPDQDGWSAYTTKQRPFHLSGMANLDGEDNPAIQVERSAARFDFKDGSKDKNGKSNDFTYAIDGIDYGVQLTHMSLVNMSKDYYYLRRVSKDGLATGAIIGGIEGLTDNDSTDPTDARRKYVVDTDADAKDEGKIKVDKNRTNWKHFNYPLFDYKDREEKGGNLDYVYAGSEWDTWNIKKDVFKDDANTDLWNEGGEYTIWRYVTENTIPGSTENQTAVQSTGIVFKARILPMATSDESAGVTPSETRATNPEGDEDDTTSDAETEEDTYDYYTPVKKALTSTSINLGDYPTLYFWNGNMYAGLNDFVRFAMNKGKNHWLYIQLNDIFSHWVYDDISDKFKYKEEPVEGDATLTVEDYYEIMNNESEEFGLSYSDENDNNIQSQCLTEVEGSDAFKLLIREKEQITIYNAERNEGEVTYGYYCYYFYWNRHNDNGKNTIMGNMEFAVVRNNVYKLSVSTISKLGHPTDPEDDPDPVDPNDPDEDDKVYMDVKVEVLPWVVRVNDIEF